MRPDIAAADAADVLDARGKLVVPGLIDVHVHVSAPDMTPAMLLRDGVTAMVDGGSAGADNIDALVRVARDAPNRVRIFLNLARTGVTAEGELMNIDAGDVDAARRAIAQHREWIAGVKVRLSETACGKQDLEALRPRQSHAAQSSRRILPSRGRCRGCAGGGDPGSCAVRARRLPRPCDCDDPAPCAGR